MALLQVLQVGVPEDLVGMTDDVVQSHVIADVEALLVLQRAGNSVDVEAGKGDRNNVLFERVGETGLVLHPSTFTRQRCEKDEDNFTIAERLLDFASPVFAATDAFSVARKSPLNLPASVLREDFLQRVCDVTIPRGVRQKDRRDGHGADVRDVNGVCQAPSLGSLRA